MSSHRWAAVTSAACAQAVPAASADPRMEVVAETTVQGIEAHKAEWEALAASALEPNPFYEHWMLIPAFRNLARGDVRIVFVFNRSAHKTSDMLCGVFPIVYRRSYRGLPIPNVTFWKHKHCFLCTPLLRTGFAAEALSAYLDWISTHFSPWSILEFNHAAGDGKFWKTLSDELHRRNRTEYAIERFERALLQTSTQGGRYVEDAVSSGRRKELRRLWNRLSELGSPRMVELSRAEQLDEWIHGFLNLESSGWKAKHGGAMALEMASKTFFNEVTREAFRRNRLMMLGLSLDGVLIAQKCNILASPGSFSLKIAYNEAYKRYSPGIQLEIENIHRVHRQPGVSWMDSCAIPNHPMIDHLWAERRTIQSVILPVDRRIGKLSFSLVRSRTWLKSAVRNIVKDVKHERATPEK